MEVRWGGGSGGGGESGEWEGFDQGGKKEKKKIQGRGRVHLSSHSLLKCMLMGFLLSCLYQKQKRFKRILIIY